MNDKLDTKDIVILVLIGIIFLMMFTYSNPKYDTPEWSGVSHVQGN